ncbi:hypothetical protein MKW98_005669 [Papaver atlanticum]|uniref:Uncharacterized protein n=1 Tax=Papaver atlanticum TaxID=357466 RepID=A0AAD4SS67_9MAGN|nr:hypothetical protein MKW98_005669 [Papaver atlanticum]
MKTLTVIHRALREVNHSFPEELIKYGRSRSHMLNMPHFKDNSSPNERLECFRVLKHEIEIDPPDSTEYLKRKGMAFEVLGNKVCLLGAVVGLKTLLTKSTVMTLQETLGIPLLLCRLLGFKRESLCYLRGRLSTFLGYVQSGYKQLDLSLRSKILFLTLKNHSSWMGKYTSGPAIVVEGNLYVLDQSFGTRLMMWVKDFHHC